MIFALPFPLLFIEVFFFFLFVSRFGFLQVMAFYFLPCLLGFLFLSLQSRAALMNLQRSMMEGRDPGRQLLSTAANFMAGLFLLIPTVSSRVAAACLLIPGLRQLSLLAIHAWIAKRMAMGTTRIFSGFPGGGGFRAEYRRQGPWSDESGFEAREERDAKVIDVTPIEIEHSESKKGRDSE